MYEAIVFCNALSLTEGLAPVYNTESFYPDYSAEDVLVYWRLAGSKIEDVRSVPILV